MWKSLRIKWLRICSALRTAFASDTTATSGFDTLFNDGMLLSAAVRVPTNWFGRPGHQLLGGTWNSRTYASISEAYIPYPNVATPTTQGSWCLYWNFDQYLFVDPADETWGWGPFGRAGIADPNTSPIDAFLSFGVGGNVLGRTRHNDTFGIGWYYASTSPQIGTLITSQFGPIGNGQGIECFYNYELTRTVRSDGAKNWTSNPAFGSKGTDKAPAIRTVSGMCEAFSHSSTGKAALLYFRSCHAEYKDKTSSVRPVSSALITTGRPSNVPVSRPAKISLGTYLCPACGSSSSRAQPTRHARRTGLCRWGF